MAFRGWLSLDGVELANTSRVVAHLGRDIPVSDVGVFNDPTDVVLIEDPPGSGLYLPTLPMEGLGAYIPAGLTEDPDAEGLYFDDEAAGDTLCELEPAIGHPGMFYKPSSAYPVGNLFAPPNGARQWSPGIYAMDGRCWGSSGCEDCSVTVHKRDHWSGLRDFLGDTAYRPELAPWYSLRVPESGEFMGVIVTKLDGLDATPRERTITESTGDGAVAGESRATSRKISVEAILVACTPAGLAFGQEWLTCQLLGADDPSGSVLRFFSGNPEGSIGDAAAMMREAHGIVLTDVPTVKDELSPSMAKVGFELTATAPSLYYPSVQVEVDWDEIKVAPINWVHAADCVAPAHCADMPVLFSADCQPELVELVSTPPPVCGGCMPVCGIEQYTFRPPVSDYPMRCHETAYNLVINNKSPAPLTLQGYWRICGTDERCDDNRFPMQISGLPVTASIVLDSVSSRYHAVVDGVSYQAIGIVGTPTGAPWRPVILDRSTCWELVIIAPIGAEFEVAMTMVDRTP